MLCTKALCVGPRDQVVRIGRRDGCSNRVRLFTKTRTNTARSLYLLKILLCLCAFSPTLVHMLTKCYAYSSFRGPFVRVSAKTRTAQSSKQRLVHKTFATGTCTSSIPRIGLYKNNLARSRITYPSYTTFSKYLYNYFRTSLC